MKIINSTLSNLDEILNVYSIARSYMNKNNNPQWSNNKPEKKSIIQDIENNNHYMIYDDKDDLCGVFSFIIGNDPTYNYIEGKWLNDYKYGTIHKLASNFKKPKILEMVINYCFTLINNIRIDTFKDNKTMLHLLEKYNFTKCGIIYLEDKSPRIAFQKYIK